MRRSQGVAITCAIGADVGGLAAGPFHVHTLPGLVSLSTWLTAIAGATGLPGTCHLNSGRTGRSMAHR
jgi:hypothetical protein